MREKAPEDENELLKAQTLPHSTKKMEAKLNPSGTLMLSPLLSERLYHPKASQV